MTDRSDVHPLLTGHVVGRARTAGDIVAGRYRLVRRLGAGSMGEVFEAEHTEIPRRFALKMLGVHYSSNEEARRRFRSEAEVGALLQSPHLVSVFDYQVEGDLPFFVMELLEGEDVRALLRRASPIGVAKAVRIALGAASGLRVAHRNGIVHRDLKPANLFLSQHFGGELCKVIDFGVAKLEGGANCPLPAPASSMGKMIGTLAYMPPEQIRADRPLDGRADVYSLGAILYEMLSGARPFRAESDHELMYKILHGDTPALGRLAPTCPASLAALVERAMSKDPGARCTMDDLHGLLERLAGDREALDPSLASANPTVPDLPVRRSTPPRRRIRRALAIAAGLGGAGVLAFHMLRSSPGLAREGAESVALAAPVSRAFDPARAVAGGESLEPQPAPPVIATQERNAPEARALVSPRRASASKASTGPDTLPVERRNPYQP